MKNLSFVECFKIGFYAAFGMMTASLIVFILYWIITNYR